MPPEPSDPSDQADEPGESSAEARVEWVRHQADLARAAVGASVWLLAVGLAAAYQEDARGLSTRLVLLVDGLPDSIARLLIGLVQVAALVAPLVAIALVRRGRWRELALTVGAASATGIIGVLTSGTLADAVPPAVLDEAERPSWITGAAFPSGTYLAAAAAAATVLAPTVPRRWRRTIWSAVAVVALARAVTAVETPVGLVSSVAAGVFVGSLVMFVARAPLRWPSAADIAEVLQGAGLAVATARATDERHRHGPTYEVDGVGGERWFAKVVGRDDRDAELFSRALRALRASSPDDRRALGATETVRSEALNLLLAARGGTNVPTLVTVTQSPEHGAVLVMEHLEGHRLDGDGEPSDEELARAFGELAALHAGRLAHGWANLHHVVVGPGGDVHLLDLRWATPSASEGQLARDVAELLVHTASRVGVERAVAAAASVFSSEQLGAALPLVQPLAVAAETRAAARQDKSLLKELRDELQRSAGVESYEMAKLERLSFRKVLMFVATLVMASLLLSLFGDIGEIWSAIKGADPAYIPLLVVGSLLGFPTSAVSLMGAVNVRLDFFRTTEIMFAQSFLNRFTPANAGGMALRTRYLQRNGVPLVNAASSVGLTSAASGVMQVAMAVTFFAWAGRSEEGSGFSFPSVHAVLVVVVVLLAALGVALATAFGRKLLADLRVNLGSIVADLRQLARQPAKLAMLFGGALTGKLFLIITFSLTMQAFGEHYSFAVVGAVYITATTVASASPTPGGVGAIEAALAAGLTGLGIDPGDAAAIVLVFRLFTYWLPILPCWWALTRVQRAGDA